MGPVVSLASGSGGGASTAWRVWQRPHPHSRSTPSARMRAPSRTAWARAWSWVRGLRRDERALRAMTRARAASVIGSSWMETASGAGVGLVVVLLSSGVVLMHGNLGGAGVDTPFGARTRRRLLAAHVEVDRAAEAV